jgi:hypothetical protein
MAFLALFVLNVLALNRTHWDRFGQKFVIFVRIPDVTCLPTRLAEVQGPYKLIRGK